MGSVCQDLVIPPFKDLSHFVRSPLAGGVPQERFVLAYFNGRHLALNPNFARGIRKRLTELSVNNTWWQSYNISINDHNVKLPGGYGQVLGSSKFCIVGKTI